MEMRERAARGPGPAGQPDTTVVHWSERTGWVRCQVMGRPAQIWTRAQPDTHAPGAATTRAEDPGMLKKAKHRASAIWSSSADLYREMALSALRLVRR